MEEADIFGEHETAKTSLWEKYGVNPFTLLDARDKRWQERRRYWLSLGIEGETTRESSRTKMRYFSTWVNKKDDVQYMNFSSTGVSIFDPVLCEQIYRWYCPVGGSILDPFAGGSVRGIVAGRMGMRYLGIDIREDQCLSNRRQAETICSEGIMPHWVCGDSRIVVPTLKETYNMVFSCPPYFNMEVYSKLDGDISNMRWPLFLDAYKSIIGSCCDKLKPGGLAVFVVGEVRGRNHYYKGLVPATIRAFMECGMGYYNEAVYCMPFASAPMRADGSMKYGKLVKVHQNVLMFQKEDREGKRIYNKSILI